MAQSVPVGAAAVMLLQVLAGVTLPAAGAPPPQSSLRLYKDVLDHVFAHQADRRAPEYLLRFSAGLHELQVVFADVGGDSIEIQVWFVPDDEPSIFDQLNELRNTLPRTATAGDVAEHVKFERQTIDVSRDSRLGELLMQVQTLALSLRSDDSMFLEGIEYRLEAFSISRDIAMVFRGPLPGGRPVDEVHAWLIAVRDEVSGLLDLRQ